MYMHIYIYIYTHTPLIVIRAARGNHRVGISAILDFGAGGRWKLVHFYFVLNHNLPISSQQK